jgi:hypothetical protein
MSPDKKKWFSGIRGSVTHIRQGLRAAYPLVDAAGEVARIGLTARRGGAGAVVGLVTVATRALSMHSRYAPWQTLYTGRIASVAASAFDGEVGYVVNSGMAYQVDGFEVLVDRGDILVTPGFDRLAVLAIAARMRARYAGGARMVVSRDSAATLSVVDESRAGLRSEFADLVEARARAVLSARGRRSVLLSGPPGVGKSVTATWVARRLAAPPVLFVGASGCRSLGDLSHLCAMMQPGAVVLDDVERFEDVAVLLDFLEADERPPLVLMTTNTRAGSGEMPAALTRCKRVDETFEMNEHLENAPRVGVFNRLPDAVWERVRNWPAASLQEVATRAELIGMSPEDLRLDEIEARGGEEKTGAYCG